MTRKLPTDPDRVKHLGEWKNVGPRVVHDLKPGETGELHLTNSEAASLVRTGHLAPVEGENGHSAEEKEEVLPKWQSSS